MTTKLHQTFLENRLRLVLLAAQLGGLGQLGLLGGDVGTGGGQGGLEGLDLARGLLDDGGRLLDLLGRAEKGKKKSYKFRLACANAKPDELQYASASTNFHIFRRHKGTSGTPTSNGIYEG